MQPARRRWGNWRVTVHNSGMAYFDRPPAGYMRRGPGWLVKANLSELGRIKRVEKENEDLKARLERLEKLMETRDGN